MYLANENRYDTMPLRHAGKSGLVLPPVSLGLWRHFSSADSFLIVVRSFSLHLMRASSILMLPIIMAHQMRDPVNASSDACLPVI